MVNCWLCRLLLGIVRSRCRSVAIASAGDMANVQRKIPLHQLATPQSSIASEQRASQRFWLVVAVIKLDYGERDSSSVVVFLCHGMVRVSLY